MRFNPFDDTGSDQSFAIALLDDARDVLGPKPAMSGRPRAIAFRNVAGMSRFSVSPNSYGFDAASASIAGVTIRG